MNIYDRIVNILLEARVEMYIEDRLDEMSRWKKEYHNLSLGSKQRIGRRMRAGDDENMDHPLKDAPEANINRTKGSDPKGHDKSWNSGRYTKLAAWKERKQAEIEEKKRKKKRAPKLHPLTLSDVREKPKKGPGRQTGPIEKRGIPQRGK